MRQLVRDEAVVRPIARDEGGGEEGHHRVFHPAIGKGGGQHDHVVTAPAIFAVEVFRRRDHRFGIAHFARGPFDYRRFGPDAAARAERAKIDIARRDRDQIGRHRLVHHEAEGAASIAQILRLALAHPAHHHVERLGRGDPRFPGLADAGAVLRRDPAAIEDRLALAEEERVFAARGLFRAQPLQRFGILGRGIPDANRARIAHRNGQRRALAAFGHRLTHGERQIAARSIGDAGDAQPVRIEHDLARIVAGQHIERRGPANALPFEIERQVERDMRDPRDLRLRIGQRIERFRPGQNGRNHGFGRCGGQGHLTRHRSAGGAGQQQGERGDDATHEGFSAKYLFVRSMQAGSASFGHDAQTLLSRC